MFAVRMNVLRDFDQSKRSRRYPRSLGWNIFFYVVATSRKNTKVLEIDL